MNNEELQNKIDVINDKIKELINDFESMHDLKKDVAYQIHSTDCRSFNGYYSRCEVASRHWGDREGIYIYAWFFKLKKDRSKSKVKTGCFAHSVIKANILPF